MMSINPVAYFVLAMLVIGTVAMLVAMHREERWHHHRKYRNVQNHLNAQVAGETRYEYTDPYGSVSLRSVAP